jgi:hypothetical protein
MSLVEARERRERLRNPPNAVMDDGIDLKRHKRVEVIDRTPEPMPVPVPVIQPVPQPKVKAASETDEQFLERQIKYHEGRLNAALRRREVLSGKKQTSVLVEDIQQAVCGIFNVKLKDMLSARRTGQIVRPRHVAMHLAKTITMRSLPEIGRRFGGRDHTTVLHAVNKIAALREADAAFDEKIKKIESLFVASPSQTEDAPCSSPQTTAT